MTVGAASAGVLGAVVGLVLGLRSYAPTAWFAVIEVAVPSAVTGGVLGLLSGSALTAVRRHRSVPPHASGPARQGRRRTGDGLRAAILAAEGSRSEDEMNEDDVSVAIATEGDANITETDSSGDPTLPEASQDPDYDPGAGQDEPGDSRRGSAVKAPTAGQVLATARSQIGIKEDPPGSNKVKYSTWYRLIGPWCAMFVSWVAHETGAAEIIPRSAGVAATKSWFQKRGQWHTRPRRGDLVIFTFSHIGFVEAINDDGTITTIEGNTDVAGGRTGGRVMRQYRRTSTISGYCRPRYGTGMAPGPDPKGLLALSGYLRSGSTGPAVTALQKYLNAHGYAVGREDGDFGARTGKGVRAFQRDERLEVDGVVGRSTAVAMGWRWTG